MKQPSDTASPKTVCLEILSATMFAHRYIFEESVTSKGRGKEILDSSKIYFLCTIPKLRFDLEKTTVDPTGILKTYLYIGGIGSRRINIPLLPFLGEERTYQDLREINWTAATYKLIRSKSNNITLSCSVTLKDSTTIPFLVPVSGLFWIPDLKIGSKFDISYIGQSFSQIIRLKKHEKINELTSKLDDHRELCVLSIEFSLLILGAEQGSEEWDLFTMNFKRDSRMHKILVNIIERLLIFFIKPPMNKNLTQSKLSLDDDIKRYLAGNHIRYVNVGIGMEAEDWAFTCRGDELPELAHYDLDDETIAFREGLAPMN